MAAIPVTVTSVARIVGGLWAVELLLADGTHRTMIVPESLATLDAVRWGALAYATLVEHTTPAYAHRRPHHTRLAPTVVP